jgi:putative tryptophan/tyrosine transport system substrate-binding protein
VNRRQFITLLGGAVAAWPLAASAQQAGKVYRIGFLGNDPTIPMTAAGAAFRDGLRDSGFIEGENILIDWRFAEGRADRYAELAATLVRLRMDLIVASSGLSAMAAKQATKAIPIVMMNVTDPVGQGIVASLAHPGGNISGVIEDETAEIAAKRMQLLKDAVPQIAKVAVLMNPDNSADQSQWRQLEFAARSLKLMLRAAVTRQASEFESAFAEIERDRPNALIVVNSGLNFTNRTLIMELAGKSRLPAMSNWKETTEAGGLMSYGSNRLYRFRSAAIYVGKILKGAKPADLPVEQPTKYELIINLKTARSLNLEIPRDLLLVADEVIE